MNNQYPQIIYGDIVSSFKEFCVLSEEFEVKRCIKCGKQFWEYLGGYYDRGFVCDKCVEKYKDEEFNVGKGNNYGIEKTEHWRIPKKGCIVTDAKVIAN